MTVESYMDLTRMTQLSGSHATSMSATAECSAKPTAMSPLCSILTSLDAGDQETAPSSHNLALQTQESAQVELRAL